MAWNRHAIAQTQLRKARRVDGVGSPKLISTQTATGPDSEWHNSPRSSPGMSAGTSCRPVWKSNFRRRTPSTRCCLRASVCAMAWRFHAIDAPLSPCPRRLDGLEAHEGSRNISQDNLTHWLISTRLQTPRQRQPVLGVLEHVPRHLELEHQIS